MFGHQFYPTQLRTGLLMCSKVDWDSVNVILDPSAGKGDLFVAALVSMSRLGRGVRINGKWSQDIEEVLAIKNKDEEGFYREIERNSRYTKQLAIEIDPDLQNVLRGRGYTVIGSDFLNFTGADQPDLIMMNPPFERGAEHLLHAIDYMFSGQIVCILNAETLRNPYSIQRQDLIRRLHSLNATIDYHENEFVDAEHKTNVEIAIVYINIVRDIETDIFGNMKDQATEYVFVKKEDTDQKGLVHSDRIHAIIERYEHLKATGIDTIMSYYKNHVAMKPYMSLQIGEETNVSRNMPTITMIKQATNTFLINLRQSTWSDIMDDKAISKYLTSDKIKEYRQTLSKFGDMDVTIGNLRTFVAHISDGYQGTLTSTIEKLFDDFTMNYSYYPECKSNVHLYNGWKSNNAFRINNKIVIPNMNIFDNYSGRLRDGLAHGHAGYLADIEKVLSYFDKNKSIEDKQDVVSRVNAKMTKDEHKNIVCKYFTLNFYKKGTMHIQFTHLEVLRRFNIFIGKNRNYLPHDYSTKPYSDMNEEYVEVVSNFEGASQYVIDRGVDIFSMKTTLLSNDYLMIE
jgi:hypothetical protein